MRARKGSGSFLNGRSREKWRSKRQKQNKGIAKAGCHPKMVAPRLFCVYMDFFFFRGPLGLEVGLRFTPLGK